MKTPLKLLSLYAALLLCVLVIGSCKKDPELPDPDPVNGNYYMRFKANGVLKEFKGETVGAIAYDQGEKLHIGVFGAFKDLTVAPTGTENHLSIAILSESPITNSIYQDPLKTISKDGSKFPQVLITYYDEVKRGYQSMGILADENGVVGNGLPGLAHLVANAKATITEVKPGSVKGTFSGKTFGGTELKDEVNITEGEFFVKREQ